MSKCEQCGSELVWVGSMQDGRLECPHCLAVTLWSDARSEGGFDDVTMQPMQLAKQEKFTFADPYHTTVKCPACGHVSWRPFIGVRGDKTVECPHCGIWAEVEQ